jgi:putative nucleotidyltransferase with HDIG domain
MQPGGQAGRLDADQVELIVRGLGSLPTLPAMASRLLALPGEADSAAGEALVEVISADPPLTARLLSVASAAAAPARTVGEAVERLGVEAARSAALSAGVCAGEAALDGPAFRRHCLAVACAAELLCRHLDPAADPACAFVCGLLHDLGKLAASHCLPKSYARAVEAVSAGEGNIADHERRIIGVDHTVFGRRLAERWRLPQAVREAVWLHHQPPEALPASLAHGAMVSTVCLADTLAREQAHGFSGNHVFALSAEALAERLGVPVTALREAAEALPHRLADRLDAADLHRPGGEALHRDALAAANTELGRLNADLRRRAAALETHARAFTHFSEFAASLRGEASVAEVLTGAAGVLAAAADLAATPRAPIVAYSAPEDERRIVAVRWDGSRQPRWRSVARAEGSEASAPPPAAAAPAEVATVLLADAEALSDWLDPAAGAHQALVCAGRWIGGVFLSSPPPAGREDLREALASALALALAFAQGREKALRISEQLAGASRVLSETQQALAEAKALAAVGEMAAGAAHELNTPLAVVSGRAQLMRDRAGGEEERKAWQVIADQAQRISDIITALMEYARPAQPRREAVGVEELLNSAVAALREMDDPQARAAEVDIRSDARTPAAVVDRSQVEAAVAALLLNAAQAGGEAPRIELAAGYDETDGAVLLTVTDHGGGMDPQTAERAFTPFFSARRAGRRAGMGLPRAKRYVEINGGRIWLRSRAGEGTTVCVALPAGGPGGGQQTQESTDADG